MPIDASIPLGVRPMQIESPVNQLAQILQVQNSQQQGEMNRLKMDEYQTGIREKNALRSALSAPDADPYNVLIRHGDVKGATDYLKGKADVGKTTAETDYKKIETAHKRADIMGQAFGAVRANPTVETAMQALDLLETVQAFPAEQIAKWRANAQANPASIGPFADQAFRQALSAKEQLPKQVDFDAGDRRVNQSIDPVTGKVTQTGTTAINQSANNKASVGAQYAIAGAAREQAAATRDAARISADAKQRTDVELKLQDDYRAESKGWAETSTAMKKVMAAIETADKNPGSALSAGTGFMKLLDPNSVVRETELGMALNASGWFDRATNIANTLQHGKTMTAEQKKNLSAAAKTLFEEAKKAQLEVDSAFKNRAKGYNVDAGRIIVDRGQNSNSAIPALSDIDAELARRQGK